MKHIRNYHLRTERWKDIKEYEDLYQVSNFGRVKSLEFTIIYSDGRIYTYKEKILKLSINKKNGYLYVALYKNKEQKQFLVHRLVAEAFVYNPDPVKNIEVEHKNTIRTDNCIWNLKWVDHWKNCKNTLTRKHQSEAQKGEKHRLYHKYGKEHNSSKPVLQFDLDGNFIREWECTVQIERELGINHSNVSLVCKGKRKTAGGYIWKYKN